MSATGSEAARADESHRLAVLYGMQLLEAPAEPAFDALVRAARQLTGCAAAAITLVTEDRVCALARVGLPPGSARRDEALCPHALAAGNGFFEVPDVSQDPRFASQAGPGGVPLPRFYASVPLCVEGAALGTLCVIDRNPRSLSADEREQFVGLASVATALLQQHRSRQLLQLQNDRMMDLTRASGDWMWETDQHGRYRWLSGDFERLTGLPPERCVGQMVGDEPLVDTAGDPHAGGGSLLDHLLRPQPFARVATRLTTARGALYVSRSAQPVFDAQGRFSGFRGTARDVTARKQAQQERREHDALRLQVESAERSSREKSEFLSRVSHELRTPLNAILGFAQLMALDAEQPLGAAQRSRLDGLRQAGQALLEIIDETLEVSRADASPPPVAEGAAGAAASPAAGPDLPARVVLYVEDEPLNIVLMEEIFRGQAGWVLHVARDGTEGVEMALALRPDLALIDMNLPDFNGIEVLRRLRAAPSLQGLRCIALSADAMAEQIATARAAGFDDYWTKPIDLTRLLASIGQALDAPKSAG